jgi:hypothetical protein
LSDDEYWFNGGDNVEGGNQEEANDLFAMLGDIEEGGAKNGLRVRFDLEPYDELKEAELQKRKRPPTPRPKASEVPRDDDDDGGRARSPYRSPTATSPKPEPLVIPVCARTATCGLCVQAVFKLCRFVWSVARRCPGVVLAQRRRQ